MVNLSSFWKTDTCSQTVLPDWSLLKGQKLVKNAKMVNLDTFLKTWNLWSNSVTRQVNFNKIGGKCRNWQMRNFWWFSNIVDHFSWYIRIFGDVLDGTCEDTKIPYFMFFHCCCWHNTHVKTRQKEEEGKSFFRRKICSFESSLENTLFWKSNLGAKIQFWQSLNFWHVWILCVKIGRYFSKNEWNIWIFVPKI